MMDIDGAEKMIKGIKDFGEATGLIDTGETPSCFEFCLELLAEVISLSQDLLTIFLFDEDKFGTWVIFSTFLLVPYFESWLKIMTKCTATSWDDFAIDVGSEILQGVLFSHFCSFSSLSVKLFGSLTAVQVLIICYGSYPCGDKSGDDNKKEGCMECFSGCSQLLVGAYGMVFLFFQDEAPFVSTNYSVGYSVYIWLMFLVQNPIFRHIKSIVFCQHLVAISMFVANYVLAWMYLQSGDITQQYDSIVTHLVVRGGTITLSCGICAGLCMLCIMCAGKSMLGNEGFGGMGGQYYS